MNNMISKPKNFYNRSFPYQGEIVRIIMTTINDTAVDCTLPDFNNQNGIILLADLSHQKRYRKGRSNIRNYFHKDKIVCAKVITSDENKQSIILTRKYQDEWKHTAKKLSLGNNRLITIVNTMTRRMYDDFNQDMFDSIWKELIYPITKKVEEIASEDQMIVYHYLENNFDKINIPEKYKEIFIESIKKYIRKTDKKFKTRFGLISINGIEHTQTIFENICQKLKLKNDKITYDGESGYWNLTTLNPDKKKADETHNQFIENLKEEISNKKFHIKIDYIAMSN